MSRAIIGAWRPVNERIRARNQTGRRQLSAWSVGPLGTVRGAAACGARLIREFYRAFDPTLQRLVALKLLLPSRLNREEEVSALLREARAIARVRHPNVVPIFGVDRHDGRPGFWS